MKIHQKRFDNILICPYSHPIMPKEKITGNTRQIYASVREEIYLAAKARAAELRVPLRQFIEIALENQLTVGKEELEDSDHADELSRTSVWADEYLDMQAKQPIGSPVELTEEEAIRVILGDSLNG